MDFEYQWNESYQFSQQSFGLGMLSRTGSNAWRLNTDVSAELLPLVASSDPVRRGHGEPLPTTTAPAWAAGPSRSSSYRGFRVLSVGYRGFWTATVNGASQSKLIQFGTIEARAPLPIGLSAGAAYNMYLQRSTYAERIRARPSRCPADPCFISTSGR